MSVGRSIAGCSASAPVHAARGVEFSPDGRLIAMALRPEGVRIVRASDGVGLAHLPIGHCDEVLFLSGDALLTANGLGLCRWPIRRGSGGVLRIGPPESLARFEQPAGYVNSGSAAGAGGRLVGAVFTDRPGRAPRSRAAAAAAGHG